MSEMIERVAKAIYERRNERFGRPIWVDLPAAHKAPYSEDAHAAIEAMKNPTEAMCVAGEQTKWDGDVNYVFNAMIDAVLAETEGG